MSTARYFVRYPGTMSHDQAYAKLRQIRADVPQVTLRKTRRGGATIHGELHHLMTVKLIIDPLEFEMFED